MPRGWMFSLGLSLSVLTAALVASSTRPKTDDEPVQIEADPCFSYGRFECCVRP